MAISFEQASIDVWRPVLVENVKVVGNSRVIQVPC
jgi:hypothetical protein